MWLLDKNYAVSNKLSNPAGIVPKCPKDTLAPVPKCRDTLDMPKCFRSKVWKVRSVLGPKCLYTVGAYTFYTEQLWLAFNLMQSY